MCHKEIRTPWNFQGRNPSSHLDSQYLRPVVEHCSKIVVVTAQRIINLTSSKIQSVRLSILALEGEEEERKGWKTGYRILLRNKGSIYPHGCWAIWPYRVLRTQGPPLVLSATVDQVARPRRTYPVQHNVGSVSQQSAEKRNISPCNLSPPGIFRKNHLGSHLSSQQPRSVVERHGHVGVVWTKSRLWYEL